MLLVLSIWSNFWYKKQLLNVSTWHSYFHLLSITYLTGFFVPVSFSVLSSHLCLVPRLFFQPIKTEDNYQLINRKPGNCLQMYPYTVHTIPASPSPKPTQNKTTLWLVCVVSSYSSQIATSQTFSCSRIHEMQKTKLE